MNSLQPQLSSDSQLRSLGPSVDNSTSKQSSIPLKWLFQDSYENPLPDTDPLNGYSDTLSESLELNKKQKRKRLIKKSEEILQKMYEQENKFAKVHKKVKTQHDTDRKQVKSLFTERKETNTQNTLEKRPDVLKENSVASTSDTSKTVELEGENENEGLKIKSNLRKCRSVNVFYDENKMELCFKIEYTGTSRDKKECMVLSRAQVVQIDPRLVLYFYENHLEFPDMPDFQPESLKKI